MIPWQLAIRSPIFNPQHKILHMQVIAAKRLVQRGQIEDFLFQTLTEETDYVEMHGVRVYL